MFSIDSMSQTPVYEQLINQIERFILIGALKSGDSMPSVRGLSVELSVNPNTIQKSYSELNSKGVLFSVPGKGLFVSDNAKEIIGNKKREHLGEFKRIVTELKLAGVSREELKKLIDEDGV